MKCKHCGAEMLRSVGADKINKLVNTFVCPKVQANIEKTNFGQVMAIYCNGEKLDENKTILYKDQKEKEFIDELEKLCKKYSKSGEGFFFKFK